MSDMNSERCEESYTQYDIVSVLRSLDIWIRR